MTAVSRVLCAVDLDDPGRAVFAHALALARSRGARLLIVHAVRPDVPFNRNAVERVDYLSRLRSLAEAAGVETRVTVQRGDVAEIVVLHARARRADLVVIGARRTRQGLGSIAERVARAVPCPTLVVPASAGAPGPSHGATVLCAVDFSPQSEAAVRAARALVGRGGRVILVHVAVGDEEAAAALERLQPMTAAGDGVFARVLMGSPVPEIVRAVRVSGATLVAAGVRPRGGLARRLFGRTGLLLRDAACPVLLVPAPAAQAEGTDRAGARVA